jgi:predicted metal-dependent enzyme (double-stranded beta helix superfamily)
MYDVLDRHDWKIDLAGHELISLLQRLAAEDNLLDIGLPRPTVHSSDGTWLYWDGELNILMAKFPEGRVVPVHNHGTWEIVGTYRGRLDYSAYRRLDDGSRKGFADLELCEHRVLEPGEFSLVPEPPHDLHGFETVDGDMWMLVVVRGGFDEDRLYFDPEAGTYFTRSQWAYNQGIETDARRVE